MVDETYFINYLYLFQERNILNNTHHMKNALLVLLFFCFCYFSAHSQNQNLNFGVGFTLNGGQLQGDAVAPVDSFSLERTSSILLGGNAFLEWVATDAFRLRLTSHYNLKGVRPIVTQDFGEGNSVKETLNYQFASFDVGITASYSVLPNTFRWKIYPQLGFVVGTSKLEQINLTRSASFSNSIPLRSDTELEATIEDKNSFLYFALQGGINIQPPLYILKRQVEFNTTLHYSPRSFLENPIEISGFLLNGNYHFISFGWNVHLNKSKINEK